MAPIDSPRHSDIWLKGKQSPQLPHYRKSGLDPCKVLEPKRKTLQSLEAQRIMTVFQEAVKRMEITTVLPCVLESLPRFSVIVGQDLLAKMEDHLRLQNSFIQVTAELDKLLKHEKESGDIEIDECVGIKIIISEHSQRKDFLRQQAVMAVQRIKNSLRDILRYFKKNPKSIEAILGTNLKRTKENILLMDSLKSLTNIMKERLLTTPYEQQEKKSYLADVIKREKKTNAAKEKLELKYNSAVKAKEAEIAKRDATIIQLRGELEVIEKINLEQQQRTLTDAFKQISLDDKNSKAKEAKYYEDIIASRRKIKEDRKNHRESETHLRKFGTGNGKALSPYVFRDIVGMLRNFCEEERSEREQRTFKMATEVYNWVQKYDADLENRQDEYDLYTRMYEADKAELSQLQTRFEALEKQYDAIMEERRHLEEENARKLKEERVQNDAATAIQAAWRGYQFRKLMSKKAKKEKKPGKKGKG